MPQGILRSVPEWSRIPGNLGTCTVKEIFRITMTRWYDKVRKQDSINLIKSYI